MVDRGRPPTLDYERLSELLTALGYPLRLELLDVLRFPRTLGEIRVSPHRVEPGGNPDRPASKPTVLGHLDKLIEAGLVEVDSVEQAGKTVRSYAVNPQRLYALVEDVRRLSVMHAGYGVGVDATGTLDSSVAGREETGPRLLLVHGVYEGKTYKLDATTARDSAWDIGRAEGLAVSLSYDPFVSLAHARIARTGDAFALTDHPDAKNGSTVNWRPLARGGSRTLKNGDVIGVGRSRLVFVDA